MSQNRELNDDIQRLSRETLNRYAISAPSDVREFYLRSGRMDFVNVLPKLEDFALPKDYEEADKKEEAKIDKRFSAIWWGLFLGGYLVCAVLCWKIGDDSSIWLSLLAPLFSYLGIGYILVEGFFEAFINKSIERKKADIPLKKNIKNYKDALNSYLFWEHVDFCYREEVKSAKKATSDYRYKLNFIEAHKIVSEYVNLFASGEGTAYGFPASDFSFYGLHWKEILFDAAKIWAGHAIIYGERTDEQMEAFASLLISYNLGMSREDYEYKKMQYTLFQHTGGKEGAMPKVDRFFDNEKFSDYEDFVKHMYEYKQRLIDYEIDLKNISYKVLRQLCVEVYSKTGMIFQGEDIAYFKSLENMRFDVILNRQSVYKPYEQYITRYK